MRKRRKGACREQRMLGQMRPDEEEKKGRKIQERHGRTGEYKTETERKEANEGEEEVWNNQKYLIISYQYQSGEEKEN